MKWTFETIALESRKYSTRTQFQKGSRGAYKAALRLSILDSACPHIPKRVNNVGRNSPIYKWTTSSLRKEAKKYSSRGQFQKESAGAYQTARMRGILNEICGHMFVYTKKGKQNPRYRWTDEALQRAALKYSHRQEFRNNNYPAYLACKRRKILNNVCSHMKAMVSLMEHELREIIRRIFPSTIKLRDVHVKIKRRPYIKGFEIDIFVPELNKGIEFDGTYYHSKNGLGLQRKKTWPKNALCNYHSIKDNYFKSKGIDILHIKEEDWIKYKEICIKKCFKFLGE